jgi:hypothetical protein
VTGLGRPVNRLALNLTLRSGVVTNARPKLPGQRGREKLIMRHPALVIGSVICGLMFPGITAISNTSAAFAAARHTDAGYRLLSSPPPALANLSGQQLRGFYAPTAQSMFNFFSVADQYASMSGGWAVITVSRPYVAPSDFSSDAFLEIKSRNGRQAVAVGWMVDPKSHGGSGPRLFIYRYINGVQKCPKNCGYVSRNAKVHPGIHLPTGAREFGIEQRHGAWWIGYNGKWIGYYPDSLWHGKYKKAGLALWYGQVVVSSTSPCTDMGNGQWASSPSAASFSSIGFYNGPPVHFQTWATKPALYSVHRVSRTSFRFGGGGAC